MHSLRSLLTPEVSSRRAAFATAAFVLTAITAPAQNAAAQSTLTTLTHTEDATPISAGTLRFRLINAWTRFDQRFGANGRTDLGADFSTDSLGPRQLPRLAAAEDALTALTGRAQRLTLGRLETASDARIVTTPIALEYGVTRRLSVGVLIPVVQTRRAIQMTVNRDSTGNVTFLSAARRQAAATQNASVYAAYRSAADSLGTLVTRCPTNPTAAGCTAVNANAADAAVLRAQARAFADALQNAFGVDTAGARLAPRSGSALAQAIDAQRSALATRLRTFLGASAATSGGVFTSSDNFSYIDLNGRNGVPGLLQSTFGGGLDSIRTTDRIGFGDISVVAQYLLFDGFANFVTPAVTGLQSRIAVGGAIRFATSRTDSATNIVDIGTGEGAGFELHSAMDVLSGRLGGTVVARYTRYSSRTVLAALRGSPEAAFPDPAVVPVERTEGSVLAIDLTPRFFLGEWFSVSGLYGLERSGANTYDRTVATASCSSCLEAPEFSVGSAHTAQRLGLGFRYSTVDAYLRGAARYPIEVSLSHLQTLTDAVGAPATRRDAIQLRLYYRIRR